MGCPKCSGQQSSPVAPGFVECTSLIEEPLWLENRLGILEPSSYPSGQWRVCGHRYATGEAPPAWGAAGPAKCKCGTYAIGECAECGAAVCGDHSAVYDGRRLCLELAGPLIAEAAREQHIKWLESAQLNRERVLASVPVPPPPPPPTTVTETARAINATLATLSARGNPGIEAFYVRRKVGSRLRQVGAGWVLLKDQGSWQRDGYAQDPTHLLTDASLWSSASGVSSKVDVAELSGERRGVLCAALARLAASDGRP